MREALPEVISKGLAVSRIACKHIGQRRLRLRITISWCERYCRSSILAGCLRVAE